MRDVMSLLLGLALFCADAACVHAATRDIDIRHHISPGWLDDRPAPLVDQIGFRLDGKTRVEPLRISIPCP